MADEERVEQEAGGEETAAPESGETADASGGAVADAALDAAAEAAQEALEAVSDNADGEGGEPFPMPDFADEASGLSGAAREKMELLGDVNLDVTIELGRTRLLVEDVLKLNTGSVVELEKLAGDPVDIYVNNRRVARGEVLVLNDNFCVRVSEVIDRRPDSSPTAAEGEG